MVLLNSDAFVPEGWLSRLVAPILADPLAASVTPMSNDAELASVPAICTRTVLEPGEADAIDAVARSLAPGGVRARASPRRRPGWASAWRLSPRFLARLPGFDPAFGRGYGEEVDWCQKAVALGGRHLYLPGSSSNIAAAPPSVRPPRPSSAAQRRRDLAPLSAVRHRGAGLLGTDPLVTGRLALGLAWAAVSAGRARVPVHLAHSMKGGAEMDLVRRLKAEVAARGAAVVLRVGGTFRWQVELHSAAGVTRAAPTMPIWCCGSCRSCRGGGSSMAAAWAIPIRSRSPACFWPWARGSRSWCRCMTTCRSPLLCAGGRGRSLARPAAAGTTDRAHMQRRPDGRLVDLAEWQAEWGALIAAAARIEIFSEASGEIIDGIWPEARDRLVLRPHRMLADVPRLAPPPAGAGR